MRELNLLAAYFIGQKLNRYFYFQDMDERQPLDSSPLQWLEHSKAWRPMRKFSQLPWWKLARQHGLSIDGIRSFAFQHLESLEQRGGRMIWLGSADYPKLLLHTKDPPLAISIIGKGSWLASERMKAVVGSRKATPEALQESFLVGRELVRQGVVCVSGGALGCDIAAHHGALGSCIDPLPAVVVFAGGVDMWQPRIHVDVFEELQERGACFVSERTCGYQPLRADFVVRNRIIAGMVDEVLLMQAGARSGAMTTVRKALDYGRDIRVLRPDQGDSVSDGSWQLIDEGAEIWNRMSFI